MDIETARQKKHFSDLDEKGQQLWRDFQKRFFDEKTEQGNTWGEEMEQNEEIATELLYADKAGLFAEFGRIVCICVGYRRKEEIRTNIYMDVDESWLLSMFVSDMDKMQKTDHNIRFFGHNIKEFDIPYIVRRMIANEMEIPAYLNTINIKPWEVKHVDSIELWKCGSYKDYISLDRLCYVFGIESPKDGEIKGKDVGECFWGLGEYKEIDEKTRFETIGKYCMKDVKCLPEIASKFFII